MTDNYDPQYEECKDCFQSRRIADDWGRCAGCANLCEWCGAYVDYDLDGDLRCEMCPIEMHDKDGGLERLGRLVK